jgi:hypothetical protein
VITGGCELHGFDELLTPIAQQSQHQLLAGIIIELVLG